MNGLEGLRVLELGEGASSAYAAKLLADLGAEVVKVEPPSGDPLRTRGPFPGGVPDPEASGIFLYLNANKGSVVLDPSKDAARLGELLAWADVVFHDLPRTAAAERGLDPARLLEKHPRLVVASITPFGAAGPYADWKGYELNVQHGGGWAWLSPGASDRPDLPPLKAAGRQSELQGGLAAALAALAAHHRALETGEGEFIDLSMQEFVASFLEMNFVHYTYGGRVASRLGRRMLYPWGIYDCADGQIFLVIVEPDQYKRLIELMGNPEWATWEIFKDPYVCAENWDAMKPYLDEWMAGWKVDDLWRAGQERRICFAPVFSMSALEKQEQLRSRGFFVEVEHPKTGKLRQPGPPYQLADPWWQIRRPAPRLGEHQQEVFASVEPRRAAKPSGRRGRLPLDGIRVADFSWAWAGPFCGMNLAHLGADVIKIESLGRLDLGRRIPILPPGMEPGPNRSGYFNQWGQGKRSVQLNLQDPRAVDIAKKLVAKCDVVIDNYATGVMERLGLDYESLRKVKPDIIAASISGYGHTGPQKAYMGYGPAIVNLAGLSSLTGYPGGGPSEVGLSYGDPNGGINAAVAIVAAIVARDRTGLGQGIDVSLWEAVSTLVPEGWMEWAMNGREPERIGNRDPWMAPHDTFRCAGEDEWVTIACGDDPEWRALAGAIGRPELGSDARFRTAADRKRNEDALGEILAAWTAGRDKWTVTRELQAAGVAAFPSMNSRDLADDPHLAERGFFAKLEHPEVGARVHTGIPWRLANAPNGVRAPAPCLGADTEAVLTGLLGYSAADVARLREEKVLY